MNEPSRVQEHPVLGKLPQAQHIAFTFAGRSVASRLGETLAAALWAVGVRSWGPVERPQGATLYCGTGHCFACRVTVDGVPGVRACLLPVRSGMRVEPDLIPEGGSEHAD
jgi:sarcosine oxidase subunit alpha